MNTRPAIIAVSLAVASLLLAGRRGPCGLAADPPPPAAGRILLVNGDFLSGELAEASDEAHLAWQATAFAAPFEFALSSVATIEYPRMPVAPLPQTGDYRLELSNGDNLTGTLRGISGSELVFEIPGAGDLHIDVIVVRRISRWRDPAPVLYAGPGRVAEWESSAGWREDHGGLISPLGDSVIHRPIAWPPRACVELALSWEKWPEFELALAMGDTRQAFRLETWDGEFVLLREAGKAADVVVLQNLALRSSGRIHLQIFLDQSTGTATAYRAGSDKLGDLQVPIDPPLPSTGIQLTKKNGPLCLEVLRVGNWNGDLPRPLQPGQFRMLLDDGTLAYGTGLAFAAESGEFHWEDDSGPRHCPEARVQDIVGSTDPAPPHPSVRVKLTTGEERTGTLSQVTREKIGLKIPGLREELSFDMVHVQSLTVLHPAESVAAIQRPRAESAAACRLEAADTLVHGQLVDTESMDAAWLNFEPDWSANASALRESVSVRIVAENPTSGLAARHAKPARQPGSPIRLKLLQTIVHLTSGEAALFDDVTVNERGVTLTSRKRGPVVIPPAQVRALQFQVQPVPDQIGDPKFRRFLTVPRIQRENPPTHVVQSIHGDFLRGRLISLDATTVEFEHRLQPQRLPRDRVARIIFLPTTGGEDPAPQRLPQTVPHDQRVRILSRDGNLLNMAADGIAGSFLIGRHELLGDCLFDLQDLNQLLIGDLPGNTPTAFADWTPRRALDPTFATDEAGASVAAERIGQAAPDIALKQLDGQDFRLANHRGKIVVLDFWASWCQPCRQSLPQIDAAVRKVAPRGVELYTVNLQESETVVQTVLDQLQLKILVALDRSGRVAESYDASSIPHTVIVDRDGKIYRLFSGADKIGTRLSAALEELLAQDRPPP